MWTSLSIHTNKGGSTEPLREYRMHVHLSVPTLGRAAQTLLANSGILSTPSTRGKFAFENASR